jgi:hypothetical protein
MRTHTARFGVILLGLLVINCEADGRGFGGFRGGSFGGFHADSFGGYRGGSAGGFHADSFSGGRSSGWGGYHSDDFSGSRSGGAAWGSRGAAAGGTYDRNYEGSRGGSVSTEGYRGGAVTPWGGAAGRGRETTITGPDGRSYSSASRSGAAWNHFPTDGGLSRYSSFGGVAVGHSTTYWSHSSMTTRAGYVRTSFGYYGAFRGNWYGLHPAAWRPTAWAVGADAWAVASWATLSSFWWSAAELPVYYDYGNTVVYQNNNVYVNGSDAGTAEQYAEQATTLATQGAQANPPATDQWQSFGVFALVQGEEKTSNNIFQLAANQAGTIRGNYYDGLMDTTTPVYGSIDKKTQRAAWTIGKKTDRVFETGVYNLTHDQTPVLVHFGKDRTQQWLLVRMQQPKQ